MKKVVIIIVIIAFCSLSIKPFLRWQNDTIGITQYTIKSEKIPPAFDGYKIMQLSDIQGKKFGANNKEFISKIENENADMIVFTGDLVDEGVNGSEAVIDNFLENATLPKAVYAVSGNHDKWTGRFEKLKEHWENDLGIKFLENKSTAITKDNQVINLYGIADPDTWDDKKANTIVKKNISDAKTKNGYNILLFHRANMLELFKNEKFDLILSGHMHGGQIRIPFVGGLKSPHGIWFPKYSGGRYDLNNNTYIVSRGIGNAVSVPRIFNRPEIVVITLKIDK